MSATTMTRPVALTDLSARPVARPAGRMQPAGRPQVRLTRRGRLVVFLGAMALVLASAVYFGASSVATERSAPAGATDVVVVQTGDTLWSIADDAAGTGETAEMVDEIEELNGLDSAMLVAGQRILVPTD